MRLYIFLALITMAVSISWPWYKAIAQDNDIQNMKIIGILGMPALCYWDCKNYDIPIPLYYTPEKETVPATYLLYNDIENWPDFEEYEYESAGALVYEKKDNNWYKIKRNAEFFWVYDENTDNFLSYPEILHDRLTFLITKTEKPVVRDAPDRNLPGRSFTHDYMKKNYGEIPVKIIETQLVDNEWWVKVSIQDKFICQIDRTIGLFEGWMPAYNENNERNFWYYPRGC